MEKGIPSEALGWDVQAAHAIALARAGKTEEALKENQALLKKIDFTVRHGALPDLRLGFLGKKRSKTSLLKQTLLQKAIILAIAGRPVESFNASAAAGSVEVNNPTQDDQAAIQPLLRVLAKVTEPLDRQQVEELKHLQGDWDVVSLTLGGEVLPLPASNKVGSARLQIKGNTFTMTQTKPNGEKPTAYTGLIKIDGTKNPKTIDFIGSDQRQNLRNCIYELKAGTLRICYVFTRVSAIVRGVAKLSPDPVKRPTTFDSPPGSNIILMEYQRKRPEVNADE
jgi:uncharacterized protein (TIGR03067 family)